MKRKSKVITDPNEIEYLLSRTEKDCISLSFIMEAFGSFNGKARFQPFDIFTVPAGRYGPPGNKNTEPFVTNVGAFVYNRAFIENQLFDVLGYVQPPVTKKVLKRINNTLSHYVLEDKIHVNDMKTYVLKTQKFQPYCNILSPSLTEAMLLITKTIRPKKKELMKKYEKELKSNDPIIAQKIENELLAYCAEQLKGDPAMDLFDSGAKLDWGNNFKNVFVMRGASKNADPSKGAYTIIESDFMDGIPPEEYSAFCDSLTGGPYARAKKTEVGGAWEKLFVKSLEHLHVLPEGTDCHTKKTTAITLTKDNIDYWMYSYIVENGKYIELTSDNANDYIGKTVNMRYSSLCESKDGICSICAGHLFNRLGITNVGVACYIVPSKIKLKSMKSFHDATVKTTDMVKYGLNKIFGI